MLRIEDFVTASPEQWHIIINGMRNPKNSWNRSDSYTYPLDGDGEDVFRLGLDDGKLAMTLCKGGPVHAKFRRMIPVWVTINAPLYWWKEFDTYKVGTVCNSCSTMHKIHAKEFVLDDFSHEHLNPTSRTILNSVIRALNMFRSLYIDWDKFDENTKNAHLVYEKKDAWWQMIQLLPTSYNQKRTIMLNYEVLVGLYKWRKDHKLDEWHTFCHWIEELPYSELIIGEAETIGD